MIEPSRMYIFVRSRQIEGTFPGSPETGCWITTSLRVSKGWGMPAEQDWPYDGDAGHWPPVGEPPRIDQVAKANRVLAYQRVSTIAECCHLLAASYPVVAAFQIDASWSNAPGGVVGAPDRFHPMGGHSIVLAGYDKRTQQFKFRNSWGTSWGDGGYGELPYAYLSERFLEGWAVLSGQSAVSGLRGISIQTWGIRDGLGGVLHGVEVYDSKQDEMLAWSFAVERADVLHLEELFVRPAWRRQGYARKMVAELRQLGTPLRKPLQAWVPHSDSGAANRQALEAVMRELGLALQASPCRWAAAVAK